MRGANALLAALALLAPIAGCLDPDEPGPVAGEIRTRTTNVGEALRFAVPSPTDGARYVWDFGDGNTTLGPSAEHAYEVGGVYRVAWQELRGTTVVRSATGVVVVQQPLDLAGRARSTDPSEVGIPVGEGAASLRLTFRADGNASEPITVILADPSGAPVVTQALTVGTATDVVLEAPSPMEGEWLLYVETLEGPTTWTAKGKIAYAGP